MLEPGRGLHYVSSLGCPNIRQPARLANVAVDELTSWIGAILDETRNTIMKNERALRLTASEFLSNDKRGMNQQVVNARWQFLLALNRQVPEVFERLRNDVYPVFARLAKPGYWSPGRTFSMWQSRYDPDRHLTPVLMTWAHRFHLADEIWILEGALQTLSNWNKFAHSRESLEILGFRKPLCVPGLVANHEHAFHFEDEGWDPTLISFPGWRAHVTQRFKAAIQQHRQQMQALVKERGGVPAVVRSQEEHFDWLALYQCADATLESILEGSGYGDKTTISKGMHQAAELARIRIRPKRRKLNSR